MLSFILLDKQGPGGVWCDVDVVEFSYYGAPAPTPKEQLYDELVDGLRGSDPIIGSGSQVLLLCLSCNILTTPFLYQIVCRAIIMRDPSLLLLFTIPQYLLVH
jgi:hypothetical protein